MSHTDESSVPVAGHAMTAALGGRKVVAGVFGLIVSLTLLAIVLPTLVLRRDEKEIELYGTLPPFTLRDHTGAVVSNTDLHGKVVIADFIFTRCQTVCPVLSMKMQRLQENTADVGDDVKLISFSVDPEYDTPEILAKYAARHHADPDRWRFVTGDIQTILQIAGEGFRVALERVGTTPNGAPDIAHDEHFILLDRSGRVRGYYDSNDITRIERLLRDARRLVIRTR